MRWTPRRSTAARAASVLATIAAASVAAGGASAATHAHATPAARSTRLSNAVTVTRDKEGVAHVVARNFAALGYGEGFAFAQDNLCTFANDIVTVEGNRSKYFGPNGTAASYAAGTASTNLQSDLFWRYVQTTPNVKHVLTAAPPNGMLPQVRQLYTGWVAGYNRYLRSGKLKDPTCRGKAWVHPITLRDMILRGEQIVMLPSSQQFVSGIVAAAPPGVSASVAHAARSTRRTGQGTTTGLPSRASVLALKRQFAANQRAEGSNAIGLGSQDTRSGHGMVLANPHFPWRGTERFWMAQLDVPGQYDMEGGTLMGFPFIGIGFNRHIAWSHTNATDQRFVPYQLKLAPNDPTSYVVDGHTYKMGHRTVSVHFRGRTVRHTFYTSRWGVLTVVPQAFFYWTSTTAYALDDFTAPALGRAANEYLRMGQSTSVHQLFNVESKYLALPVFNTTAADDHGNAYYGDVGDTPAVSAAEISSCLPAGAPAYVYQVAGIITLDGSRGSCAPADEPGTPQKGIFSAQQLPHLFRRDYVENSNDSFWLTNPTQPLTGFSPIIGHTDVPQDGRTRLAKAMIAARVAGTDGLGAPKFTLATLQRMWEGDKSQTALEVLPDLVADCRAHPTAVAPNGTTVDLTAACAALAGWHGTSRLTDKGGWLFTVFNDLDTDSDFYSVAFDPTKPLTTPTGLNTTTANPLKWLAAAVQSLRAHHIPLNASYGQVQHAPQSRSLPVGGCSGEIGPRGMGCFNAIYAPDGTAAYDSVVNSSPYGQVNDGSSLVMTTQLNPSGPVSQGVLTYSQATDPTSPWYRNMTKLYSEGKWAKLPYTAAQLRSDHPGKPLRLQAP